MQLCKQFALIDRFYANCINRAALQLSHSCGPELVKSLVVFMLPQAVDVIQGICAKQSKLNSKAQSGLHCEHVWPAAEKVGKDLQMQLSSLFA